MAMSVRMRRWIAEMGSRSSRAPAFTLTSDSLFPAQGGQRASGEGVGCKVAVSRKGIILGGDEKLFTTSSRARIECQNAGDERVSFAGEAICITHFRNQSDFQGLLRSKGFAEKNQRKSKPRQCIFAQIGHDGRRS